MMSGLVLTTTKMKFSSKTISQLMRTAAATNGISVRMEGWEYWNYNYEGMVYDFVRGSDNSDRLYTAAFDRNPDDELVPEVEEDIVYSLSGWQGDDILHIGGGVQSDLGWRRR